VDTFFDEHRNIHLTGEAYMEVKSIPNKPFNVYFSQYRLQVVGTKFNIRNIQDEKAKEITVTEGAVRVFVDSSAKAIELKAGDQLVLVPGKEPIVHEVHPENYISWLTGNLNFQKCTLEEVILILSRNYKEEIVLPSQINACKFTGDLSGLPLEDALTVICISNSFQLERSNDKYFIQGLGCE
jgi:ferric-dicitrate binding protein FerR (iron transport regulator)